MSDFQFTEQLQQHTPILHFQHTQDGATLRATEVKPKLDKWILTNYPELEDDVSIRISGSKALNYKMSFQINEKNQPRDPGRNAAGYFGNMGDGDPKFLIKNNKPITLKIFCFDVDLLKIIKKELRQFFLCHNFGSRQNRGYGSFTIIGEVASPIKSTYSFRAMHNDNLDKRRKQSLDKIAMSNIDWLYKSLRQGINHGTFKGKFIPWLYMKPMIFQYAVSQDIPIQWEKKTIKEAFFSGKLNDQIIKHPSQMIPPDDPLGVSSNRKRIVRDLLGLSTEQTWMNYPGRNNKPSITKKDIAGEIERATSPIRFKPIQHPEQDFYTIYFWSVPIEDDYLNSTFTIKKDNRDPIINNPLNLEMWQEFNIQDFLRFSFEQNRLENSIRLIDDNKGESLSNLLINIYDDIRNPQLKFND